jgi:FkbM family methyltransferase
MNLAEFAYTTLFGSPPVRALVDRLILALLPASIRIGAATVMLNPHDPVVSGALLLRVYERREIAFMVGPTGRVVALEPDPESFRFLEQTALANGLVNARLMNLAASSGAGKARLYRSSRNRDDHRLYSNPLSDGSIEIDTIPIDDLLQDEGISSVDVIKIDVQGYEGHVIEGLAQTICHSPQVQILMEFWPYGLRSAGTDPFDFLRRLDELGLVIYEVKDRGDLTPINEHARLIHRFQARNYTNLALLGPDSALLGELR